MPKSDRLLGKLDYVTRGAGNDLIIVGRYGAREICITVPGSEVADLAAGLGRPMAKRQIGPRHASQSTTAAAPRLSFLARPAARPFRRVWVALRCLPRVRWRVQHAPGHFASAPLGFFGRIFVAHGVSLAQLRVGLESGTPTPPSATLDGAHQTKEAKAMSGRAMAKPLVLLVGHGDGTIRSYYGVFHEGKLWLVTAWLVDPRTQEGVPERIIRVNSYQKGEGRFDYDNVLLPRAVIEGASPDAPGFEVQSLPNSPKVRRSDLKPLPSIFP